MNYLPDINVWLALTFDSHTHHPAAKAWFDGLGDNACSFCRMTQQGFLRLATNPKAFGSDAVTMDKVWLLYDGYIGDPRIGYAEEPAAVEPLWRSYSAGQKFSPKVWNDAYLAAFAKAAGLQLVTCDRGFNQYQGLSPLILI